MVKRKGAGYLLDSIAAILVLFVFVGAGFTIDTSTNWQSYTNEIEGNDLGLVLRETGDMEKMIKEGNSRGIKTTAEAVSTDGISVSGELTGVPPNIDAGIYTSPDKIQDANLTRVESGDRCYSDIDELRDESLAPIMRTVGGSGSQESTRDNVRLYFGNYDEGEVFSSRLNYDALWVDNGSDCSFEDPEDPIMIKDSFYWGETSGNGERFEFREINVDSRIWEGKLSVADEPRIQRFEQTAEQPLNGVSTHVDLDTFNYSDSTERFDLLIFQEMESIQRMDQTDSTQQIQEYLSENPGLFLINPNQNDFDSDEFLSEIGFEWKDLDYGNNPEANCGLLGPQTIQDSCEKQVRFQKLPKSQNAMKYGLDQKTDLSGITLNPAGSIRSKDSSEGLVKLQNYFYSHLSQDVENYSFTNTNSVDGNPESSCTSVTEGELKFPRRNGIYETLDAVSTQLGSTPSICSEDRRALNIDTDSDEDYSDEETYLENDEIEMNGVSYRVTYSDQAGCSEGECIRLENIDQDNIDLFSYADSSNIALTGFRDTYSADDRKLIMAAMYSLVGSDIIPGPEEGVETTHQGEVNDRIYKLDMRWAD